MLAEISGDPWGSPGGPYGVPYGAPYGAAYGAAYGAPYGTHMGLPYGDGSPRPYPQGEIVWSHRYIGISVELRSQNRSAEPRFSEGDHFSIVARLFFCFSRGDHFQKAVTILSQFFLRPRPFSKGGDHFSIFSLF